MYRLLTIIVVSGLSACATHQDTYPDALRETQRADNLVQKTEREPSETETIAALSEAAAKQLAASNSRNSPASSGAAAANKALATPSPRADDESLQQPPIVTAAASGNLDQVQALLASGAKLDARSEKSGDTALHYASYFRHLDIVRELIASGADVNAKNYESGFTPLMQATIRGNVEIARYLIGQGANVNATANSGNTALMLTAIPSLKVPLDLVRLLIDSGADLNIRNAYGYTALEIAVNFDNKEIAGALLSNGAGNMPKN